MTIVPTKMYFYRGKAKIQVAVGKGKKLYDKRLVKKKRDWQREKAKIFMQLGTVLILVNGIVTQ